MPEYVVERNQAHELLTRVFHQKRERLVFATPEGQDKVRIFTEVQPAGGVIGATVTTVGWGGGGGGGGGGTYVGGQGTGIHPSGAPRHQED